MRGAADYLVYCLLRAAWRAAQAVRLVRLRGILERAARLVGVFDARHRRVVRENLALAFPEWPPQRVEQVTRHAFTNWGRMVAELVHTQTLADEATMRRIAAVTERVERLAIAGRRGVLILTAHTGNFELLLRLCGLAGKPIAVFHRSLKNAFVDAFLIDEREALGVTTLGRGMVLRQVLRVLQGGGVVAAPLDQNQLPGKGVFVDFFGRQASTSTLLARLSLRTGAPVLPVFAAWQKGALLPVCGEAIEPPRGLVTRAAREDAILCLTARYTREIENMVRSYPEQWNWAHRRWKTRPERLQAAGIAG